MTFPCLFRYDNLFHSSEGNKFLCCYKPPFKLICVEDSSKTKRRRGSILTELDSRHSWVGGFKFTQKKDHSLFEGIAKIYWRSLKNQLDNFNQTLHEAPFREVNWICFLSLLINVMVLYLALRKIFNVFTDWNCFSGEPCGPWAFVYHFWSRNLIEIYHIWELKLNHVCF